MARNPLIHAVGQSTPRPKTPALTATLDGSSQSCNGTRATCVGGGGAVERATHVRKQAILARVASRFLPISS